MQLRCLYAGIYANDMENNDQNVYINTYILTLQNFCVSARQPLTCCCIMTLYGAIDLDYIW